jgi:hypothetical protein
VRGVRAHLLDAESRVARLVVLGRVLASGARDGIATVETPLKGKS